MHNSVKKIIEKEETIIKEEQEIQGITIPAIKSYDCTVKKEKTSKQVRVCSVPPEEFLISRRATDIHDAEFVCHRVKKTASELIQEGYDPDLVNKLPTYGQSQAEYMEERLARFSFDDDSIPPSEGSGATKQIWVEECYIKLDYDDDE